jgi:hypothetical protein
MSTKIEFILYAGVMALPVERLTVEQLASYRDDRRTKMDRLPHQNFYPEPEPHKNDAAPQH